MQVALRIHFVPLNYSFLLFLKMLDRPLHINYKVEQRGVIRDHQGTILNFLKVKTKVKLGNSSLRLERKEETQVG